MKDIPEGFIRRKTSTIPFGYKLSDDVKGYLEPIQVEIESLQLIEQMIVGEEISLQMGSDWLEYKTGRSISPRGLQKHIDTKYGRRSERLGE
jgi:hypothetical protein